MNLATTGRAKLPLSLWNRFIRHYNKRLSGSFALPISFSPSIPKEPNFLITVLLYHFMMISIKGRLH
jgi:hypothetical protein